MSLLDFNDAEKPQFDDSPIPDGTILKLTAAIRPGGAGDGGILKASKSSDAMMLDFEFTVTEGKYARRKIWQNQVVDGGKRDENGHSVAGKITKTFLRQLLDSALGLHPEDMSEQAMAKRRISGYDAFNGMTFIGKVGIEKDKTGQYPDKNAVKVPITPEKPEYQKCMAQGEVLKEPAGQQPQGGFGGFGGQSPQAAPPQALGGYAPPQQPAAPQPQYQQPPAQPQYQQPAAPAAPQAPAAPTGQGGLPSWAQG